MRIDMLAIPLCLSCGLFAQDISVGAHLSLGQGNATLHQMVGISLAKPLNHFHQIRFRFDTSLKPGNSNWSSDIQNSKLNTLAIEWIWHKSGYDNSSFILGAGISSDHYQWEHLDWERVPTSRSDSVQDLHLVIGGKLNRKLTLEARIHYALWDWGPHDASTTAPNYLFLGGVTWTF